jgi:RNA polymerase sigma-70 factor (ECF subfamily)
VESPDNPAADGLVRAAAAGDEVAFSQLLVRHHDSVLRSIQIAIPHHLRHVIPAEDVLQETFTDAFRHLPALRAESDGSFLAWLRAIAAAKASNAREAALAKKRGGGRRRIRLHAGDSTSAAGSLLRALVRETRGPIGRAADREGVAMLRSALVGMESDDRRAVSLRYMEGASVDEAAREMGRAPGAFRTLCWRALRRLRVAMADAGSADAGGDRR